jgi:hypothetical protein
LQHFGNLPDLQYRGSNEWSAACPHCGGAGNRHDKSDRLRLFAANGGHNARVWCRRCSHFEWADAQENKPPDPVKIKEAEELRREMGQREQRRLNARIDELRRDAYWEGWHDAMQTRHRELWRAEGISDGLQDFFKLGYVGNRQIPIFDVGWNAVNVQYRIVQPPRNVGKYRFTAGLPAPLYLTDPDNEPSGPTVLVEGAKKAIVLYANLGHKFAVVAVPSKMPSKGLIERLKDCDPVYVALDPDAYSDGQSARRIGLMLGNRARFTRLPAKPDDLLIKYGFTATAMMGYFDQATRTA